MESKSRGGGREPSRVLLAELITKMEDECETELQLSFAKLDIECDRKLDAWRGEVVIGTLALILRYACANVFITGCSYDE